MAEAHGQPFWQHPESDRHPLEIQNDIDYSISKWLKMDVDGQVSQSKVSKVSDNPCRTTQILRLLLPPTAQYATVSVPWQSHISVAGSLEGSLARCLPCRRV